MKLYTTIRPALMRKVVLRGTVLAALGGMVLLFGGLFLSVRPFNYWGMVIFCLAGCLMSWGLLPYRRLCRLQQNPHALVGVGDHLAYMISGKQIFSLPLEDIQKIEYIDSKDRYGIGLSMQDNSKLFLPYFSRYTFESVFKYWIDEMTTT